MDVQEKIEKLRKEIELNSYLYYVLDEPKLEDYEYDNLFHELEKLESENPELITPDSPTQRVGGISEKFNQVKHKTRLYSLENSNSPEELKKWYERVLKEATEEGILLTVEKKIKPEGGKRKITVQEDIPYTFDNIKSTKYLIRFK